MFFTMYVVFFFYLNKNISLSVTCNDGDIKVEPQTQIFFGNTYVGLLLFYSVMACTWTMNSYYLMKYVSVFGIILLNLKIVLPFCRFIVHFYFILLTTFNENWRGRNHAKRFVNY